MIDTHCHILPGLDDGADSIDESVKIAEDLVKAGFESVIATPHVFEGREHITPAQIKEKVHILNEVLQEKRIPLTVLPGAENYLFPDLADWYRQGKIMTLADTCKYILVELPMASIPSYTEQVFFELQIAGITPVVAHPERNRELFKTPQRLVEWVEKGIQLQINLRSFKGAYGSQAQGLAESLLNSEMIHYIGSDLHRGLRGGTDLKSILVLIEELSAHKLVAAAAENPECVINGQTFRPENPKPLRRKEKRRGMRGWLQILAGKI